MAELLNDLVSNEQLNLTSSYW